jgi:uncharacterized protein YndB with AHSA1/START domain
MTTRQLEPVTFTTPSDHEFSASTVLDAPRERVFEAWTRPDQVRRWMLGPDGWSMPVCEIDLRAGGRWRFVWRQDDGDEMEMRGTYREVVPPERIVTTESWGGDWPETVNTLVLEDRDGRTVATQTVRYPSRAARDAATATGMREGLQASFQRLARHLEATAGEAATGQPEPHWPEPGEEHRWLDRLVGEWISEFGAEEGGDASAGSASGAESVRSLGGLWVLAEARFPTPDGGQGRSLTTLGYDPRTRRYVGTWVGSMMAHLWVYDGDLDRARNTLTLACTGPDMNNPGRTRQYQDVITFLDEDHRTLTGRVLGDDGEWHDFMTVRYRRVPSP